MTVDVSPHIHEDNDDEGLQMIISGGFRLVKNTNNFHGSHSICVLTFNNIN